VGKNTRTRGDKRRTLPRITIYPEQESTKFTVGYTDKHGDENN